MRVWDAASGELLRELMNNAGDVLSIAFSLDGKSFVSGSADKTVRVWDMSNGQLLYELKGHTRGVSSVAFSTDGKSIASGSLDKMIRVWDLCADKSHNLKGHSSDVTSVA